MQLARTGILFSVVLSAGIFSLLPIETAHAQKVGSEGPVDITLESATVDTKTGQVTISGTVSCSQPMDGNIGVFVRQPFGRKDGVDGYGSAPIHCDEDGEPYAISLYANKGSFGAKDAVVTLDAWVCTADYWFCESGRLEQSVKLTKQR